MKPAASPGSAATHAGASLDRAFFDRPSVDVAPALIGCLLLVDGVGGAIVETEAYRQDDPASHSFRGPSGRAAVMFGPPGTMYVYRSYGVHWCVNLVCEGEGVGSAVLLRALAPTEGQAIMRTRRGNVPDRLLCAGPGRLTQAVGIDAALNGGDALDPAGPVALYAPTERPAVLCGPRIGISRAVDIPWRFGAAGSPYLSRPFPTGGHA